MVYNTLYDTYNEADEMSEEKKAAVAKYHRRTLMSAADRLLVELGYDGMNMNLLSKEAGYSKATVYVYFESKDEIVCALAAERLKLLRGELALVVKSDVSEPEKFKEIESVLKEFATEDGVYFDFVSSRVFAIRGVKGADELKELIKGIFTDLTALLPTDELASKWYAFYGKIKTESALKSLGVFDGE